MGGIFLRPVRFHPHPCLLAPAEGPAATLRLSRLPAGTVDPALSPAPVHAAGLYHIAIVYPTLIDLSVAFRRLVSVQYPITGAADHGVSQAIYLNDPDQNGVELYWDRPKEEWPLDENGNLQMITDPLDLNLLLELSAQSPE